MPSNNVKPLALNVITFYRKKMKERPGKDFERRLAALERRLGQLDDSLGRGAAPLAHDADKFWALNRVASDSRGTPGAVVYAGVARVGGREVQWQIGRPVEQLMSAAWDELAMAIGALGHPVRLQILRALLGGVESSIALQELPEMATTGQLYHHLRELEAGGWIHSARRGHYAVRAERIIPLLSILSAAIE